MQIYILMNASTYLSEYLFNITRNRYFTLNAFLQLYVSHKRIKIRSVIISLQIYFDILYVTVYAQQCFFDFFLMQLLFIKCIFTGQFIFQYICLISINFINKLFNSQRIPM